MIHFVSKLCEASLLSPLTSCSRNDITIRHHMRAKENFHTKFELLWLFVLELCTINPEATQMNTFVNAAQFAFVFCEHWRQTLTLIFDLFTSRVTVAVWSQYDKFEFQIWIRLIWIEFDFPTSDIELEAWTRQTDGWTDGRTVGVQFVTWHPSGRTT